MTPYLSDIFFSHRPLESDDIFSCLLLTTIIFPLRLSSILSVLSKFSHKKYFFLFWCHPRDVVTRGGPPLPSDGTGKTEHSPRCVNQKGIPKFSANL